MPRGMSRGKKIPAALGMGAAAALFAVFCFRDFAEIAAERKNGCRVGHIFAVPIFGTSKTEKTRVFVSVIFFGTSKAGVRTHVWVLIGTQLRSHWAPLPPDGC